MAAFFAVRKNRRGESVGEQAMACDKNKVSFSLLNCYSAL